MEIESWIMADREAFAKFFAVPIHHIPTNTDAILQPKELIVSMARRSKRKDVRQDLVPAQGATSAVGPGFNSRVISFVSAEWNAERAAPASPSLRRSIERLRAAFR